MLVEFKNGQLGATEIKDFFPNRNYEIIKVTPYEYKGQQRNKIEIKVQGLKINRIIYQYENNVYAKPLKKF